MLRLSAHQVILCHYGINIPGLYIATLVCPDSMLACPNGRIDGLQPPCVTTQQRCDGIIDCNGAEDEMDYNCPCSPEGSVRLVDFFLPYRGRLEFCVNGRWSTVCSRSRTLNSRAASVVCRQLGYPSEGEILFQISV